MNSDDLNALPSDDTSAGQRPPDVDGACEAEAALAKSAQDHGAIATTIRDLAQQGTGDVHHLLGLLRLLESLHREIEDGLFREALPTNRQALYALLRDMETQGGWPYIPRLRLKQIMHWIEELEESAEDELGMG